MLSLVSAAWYWSNARLTAGTLTFYTDDLVTTDKVNNFVVELGEN